MSGHIIVRVFRDHPGFCVRCWLDEDETKGVECRPEPAVEKKDPSAPAQPCSTPRLQPPGRNGDESAYDHDAPGFCVCGVRMDAHAPAQEEGKAPTPTPPGNERKETT